MKRLLRCKLQSFIVYSAKLLQMSKNTSFTSLVLKLSNGSKAAKGANFIQVNIIANCTFLRKYSASNDVHKFSMHAAQPLHRSHFALFAGVKQRLRSLSLLCVVRNLRPGSTFPNNETAH